MVGRGPRDQAPPRCCLQALPWHDSGLQAVGRTGGIDRQVVQGESCKVVKHRLAG